MSAEKLHLVLCWHLHQPQYRRLDGSYARPWTWLHGIKDYTDMAAHLEAVPEAQAVVNFSTVLLAQLEDYGQRIEAWRRGRAAIGDALLDALGGRLPAAGPARTALTRACLRAHERHMIGAFPPFARLVAEAEAALAAGAPLADDRLRDLVVWYALAWTGESLRRTETEVRDLLAKGGGYTADDAQHLLCVIGRSLRDIVPRYRRLAHEERVELSLTPHAHPILPLLIDTACAREAMPGVALPAERYPGGVQRCRWHLERALALFERNFGFRPAGCWPSEGGVSEALLPYFDEYGFAWTATGTNVLRNSLGGASRNAHLQHWQAARDRAGLAFFFRDDELSDRIGFEYSRWDAGHAVDDLVARLETLRREWTEPAAPVVSIVMDGENAWEHFPYNGWYFLQGLYARLAGHPHIGLTTFSGLLEHGMSRTELPRLVAGSWVHGNFSVWIGDREKNRAWELLAAAKHAVDAALAAGEADPAWREAVLEQLGVCEASDWFWWLGGDNRREDSADFGGQLVAQLRGLYGLLGVEPPAELDEPLGGLSAGGAGGAMRRADAASPTNRSS